MTSTATEVLEGFDWNLAVLWQGRSGVHQLDDDRRVVLTLTDAGYKDHFTGIRAEVISKTSGPIVTKVFAFDDHLPLDDLTPESAAHPNLKVAPSFHVWTGGSGRGFVWYIREPRTTRPFCEAIETWIGAWR